MAGTSVSIFGLVFLIGTIGAAVIPKIIGGQNAVIKNFPYLVSLRLYGQHFCGGSLISERHVLTAAHCVEDFDSYADGVTIHSGTSRTDQDGTVHKAVSAFSHPDYDAYDRNVYNDIAIITLEKPVVFNKHQKTIKLASHDIKYHQVASVAGWGRISRWNHESGKQLQKVRLVLLPSDKCQAFVSRELREKQVCSFRSVGTGPCHGDSGGPLVSDGELVGIVSYVEQGKCAADIPTVYTNVYAYKDFIESVTSNDL